MESGLAKLAVTLISSFMTSVCVAVSPVRSPFQFQNLKPEAGLVVTITPNPASGFKFWNWNGDLTGETATQTLVMNDEMSVTANFARPLSIDATNILNAATYQYT